MHPKLIFLGTGGDKIVVGKQLRSAGGIILQVEDNQFHIDPGPGALPRAKDYGVNLRNNVAVLASHNHMNHAHDVNAVISAMTLGGMDPKGVLLASASVIEPRQEMAPFLVPYCMKMIERAIPVEPGQRIGINEVEIRATRTHHTDESCIGFRIMTPKFSLGYTSDTGYIQTLIEDFKGVEILILNSVYDEAQDKNQLCVDDVKKLLNEIKPKLAIITHFGIKMEEADILNIARTIQRETKVQTISAKDGMAINPVSYSVTLRQKTLNLF